MSGRDIADTAGQHDGLVIAAHFAGGLQFQRAEIAGDVRPAEFVIVGGTAQWAVDHDLQGGGDTRGLAVIPLPRLLEARNIEVGNGKTGQTGFGFGAGAGRTFVADLSAGARRRAGKRRDGGRMVVRFHLHEEMHVLLGIVVSAAGIRIESPGRLAGDDGGVVGIGHHRLARIQLVRVADHGEQRAVLFHAIDHPVGIEYLVAAVFGVRLREHHQFDIGRIAADAGEILQQIIHFVRRQCQPHFGVGGFQCCLAAAEDIDAGHRRRLALVIKPRGVLDLTEHCLGHAVMDQRLQRLHLRRSQRRTVLRRDIVGDTAFQPRDAFEAAVSGDIGSTR